MDRKTKEILNELDQMRRVNWEPGTTALGVDAQTTIDILYALTRNLRLGTVFLRREREEKIKSRLEARRETMRFRESISRFTATVEEMNDRLRGVTDGILISLGYHRHDRNDWRLKCDSTIFLQFLDKVDPMKTTKTEPLIHHTPPDQDLVTLKLFDKARKGDADALKRVQAMIRDRKWASYLGDLGQEATLQLLAHVAMGDLVWKSGLVEYLNELMAELLGDKPSILEKLLVRRVVNGWIAVHTLELELAVNAPSSIERREHLDKAITRAQKRYTEAIHELARVRRLQAPKILTQAVRAGNGPTVHEVLIPMTPEVQVTPDNSGE